MLLCSAERRYEDFWQTSLLANIGRIAIVQRVPLALELDD